MYEAAASVVDLTPPVQSKARSSATWAELGLSPLACRLLALSAAFLTATSCLYMWLGLSVRWSSEATTGYVVVALLLGFWAHYRLMPATATECLIAEVVLIFILTILFANVAVWAQYAAVALRHPYADWWLAAGDARLGIHVPALAHWTNGHPAVARLLRIVYFTHMPQFALTIVGLGLLRDRERLWEYAFHFHFCLVVAVALLVVFPAVCPPAYYGFRPTIDMSHLIGQIKGFHDGRLNVVSVNELEGLVSIPSFHATGALIVTWAFRRRRWILMPLAVLNLGVIAATFVTGVHYFVDVLAALPLFAASLFAYRRWGSPLLNERLPGRAARLNRIT